MSKTLKDFVNKKFEKLKQEYLGIIKDEEYINQELEEKNCSLSNLYRNKKEVGKCRRMMAISLAFGIGLGIIELLVLDKIREKKLYHTYIETIDEDNHVFYDEDYQDKIDSGEEIYLISYEPWQEKPIFNLFDKEISMSYEKNTIAYNVSSFDFNLLCNYFKINLNSEKISGDVIDTETRYILPDEVYDKTIWEVKKMTQPDLDDFILVVEPLNSYEKEIFTLIFGISLGIPCIIFFYLLMIIKAIIPDINENKDLQEQLLQDLQKLNERLNNVLIDKENVLIELKVIIDKYFDLIEDKGFALKLNRTY